MMSTTAPSQSWAPLESLELRDLIILTQLIYSKAQKTSYPKVKIAWFKLAFVTPFNSYGITSTLKAELHNLFYTTLS